MIDPFEILEIRKINHNATTLGAHRDPDPGLQMFGQEFLELK